LLVLLLLGFIATIHPAKKISDNTDYIGLKNITLSLSPYNKEAGVRLTNVNNLSPAADIEFNASKQPHHTALTPAKTKEPIDENEYMVAVANEDEDGSGANNILNVAEKEKIDFSLLQKDAINVPETPDPVIASVEPYVPASSFSYQVIQDTTFPKIKGETYNETKARESLIKAQKALTLLNWQKIEKELKYNKQDLAKLKKVLTFQLQNLDWQKINVEVQNDLNQEQLEKLQETIKQEQLIKQYQEIAAYNEALRRQLAEQEQLIKATDQRAQSSQKAAQQQQKKLLVEMKKRRIIDI
ncbi:MAG: hypothetical protein ABUT20_62335, partial [Bacteroidota bacterium]